MLALFSDANKYLDEVKIRFQNDDDAEAESIAADVYIRAALFDVYGATVDTWDRVPTGGEVQPPDLIRELASMYMAAMRYAKRYSEETTTESVFAQNLYDMIDEKLQALRDGTITIVGITSGLAFAQEDFWPNDTYVIEGTTDPNRKFTMDMEL